MEPRKRVGIWIRVSTEMQVKDDSPEHHEQRARHYAAAKDWEVIEVYHLDAVSGKSVMDHAETKRMMRDISKGHISALIFSKLARLARNTIELLEFSNFFQKHNAGLISLAENIDTGSSAGRLFYTLIAAMAEWERAEIAERVAASVPIRAKMGKPLGGAAPYGYQWKDKQLVIDEHEAPIRKLMYELFAEYRKKGTVAKKLNAMGHRTRNGSEFTDTTIGRLLHDSTAKGVRVANYTKSLGEGKKWEMKPESEWVYITCPAIVSEELWNECNKILEQQEETNKRATKPAVHLFSGLLFCGCGGKMYVYSDGIKYKCSKCRKTKIEIADMEEIYYENLKSFLLTDEHIEKFLSKADEAVAQKELQLQTLNQDKKRLTADMDKTMQLYMSGQIPKDGFNKYYNPLDTQLKQIENTIPDIEAEIDFLKMEYLNGDTVISEAKNLYDRWGSLQQEAKRQIVEQITDAVIINGDEIRFKFSYNPAYFQNAENGQRNLMDS